jgi:molecular chaperone GrpE
MSDPTASDPTAPSNDPGDEPHATPAQPAGPGAVQGEAGAPGPDQLRAIIAALQDDLEKANDELAKAKAETLRLVADMDNLRKRTDREKLETSKFAISKFAVDIIGVADNFERAMQAVPAGAAEADPALASLVEGVGMIDGQLKSVLDRHGVKRIWPEGEMFNPHLHQPMMQQDRTDVPHGTILQVFQAGYVIDERVIRPAVVVVAKGGPKPAKADAGNGSAGEAAAEDPSNSE